MPRLVNHAEQHERILAALWEVVDESGADAVSVRNVAAKAGMSKSSLAHYYPSVGDLVAAAIEQVMDSSQRQLARLDLDDPDPETLVRALALAVPDTPARRRQAQLWLHLAADHADDHRATLYRLNERVADTITSGLLAWQERGRLQPGRSVEVEAARLHALVDGLSLQVVTEPRRMTSARVRQILTRHIADISVEDPPAAG